ncbi:hypothetical protein PanWU01x14_308600 [Parasponia andersonii]|uniref:Uncharacterized protein n=1 Tax=Parasponia andersonii TaxID=3476 RepID=A0A2P5AQX8_PARAD|nr:hypothetical protein PanWU01x14_308600 [Parasponia andersonii]
MGKKIVFVEKKSKITERKSVIEEKTEVKHLEGRPNTSKEGKPSSSSPESSNCCCKATEFLCSACLLCVCCPLAILWCCIKLPCKLGWQAAKQAIHRACCGSEKRIVAAYSSFSDIDLDFMPEDKVRKKGSRSSANCFDKMS